MKTVLKILGGLLAFVVVVLVTVQIVLSPKVCTSLVEKYAPQFIDGKLEMSAISVSLFRRFPSVTANIDDLALTYPSEMFSEARKTGVQGRMVDAGSFRRGSDTSAVVPMDTLASFRRFSASVNLLPLLRGVVKVKNVELEQPRAYLHFYADGTKNLDIFKTDTSAVEEPEDTSKGFIKDIVVKRIDIDGRVKLVYTDQADTLLATALFDNLDFDGRIAAFKWYKGRFDASLDSLMVFGNMGRDTILFDLDHFGVQGKKHWWNVEAAAKAYAATHAFGRIKIPVELAGKVHLGMSAENNLEVSVKDMGIDVATAHIDADADVVLGDRIKMDGKVSVPGLKVQKLLDEYAANFYPDARKFKTDANLTAAVDFNGWYDTTTGSLPKFKASVSLPECYVKHADYNVTPHIALDAAASAPQGGPIHADVNRLSLRADGLRASVTGSGEDVLCGDPLLDVDASLDAGLDTLGATLGTSLDMAASGHVKADVSGQFRPSYLSIYQIGQAKLKAAVIGENLHVATADDSLDAFISALNVKMGLMENRFRKEGGAGDADKNLGASVRIDSVYFRYADAARVSGSKVDLFAQASPEQVQLADSLFINPLRLLLKLGNIAMEGQDSLNVRLRDSKNTVRVQPLRSNPKVTSLGISSENGRVRLRSGNNRVFISDLGMEVKARNESVAGLKDKKKSYIRKFYDAHPDWSRDSVMTYLRCAARRHEVPEYLTEEDFKEADIKIDLGESFKKYFREWNIDGSVHMKRAALATPSFPLRTAVTGFKGSFNNEQISLDSLKLRSGVSDLSASGRVTGVRQAVLRGGTLKVNVDVRTDSLALNQLLNAYAQGQNNTGADMSDVSDDNYENEVATAGEVPDSAATSALLVIPANVDAQVNLHGKGVTYSTMDISELDAKLVLKERCLQLTGLKALSNIGTLSADAFYSTKTKEKLLAGFDITLDDLVANDVIHLVPQVDTLIPLLKSFDGKMSCTVAATARIDTCMNLINNSVDGVLRITGSDLHFQDSPEVTKLCRKLLFRKPQRATIDTMLVEGLIQDSKLEIFPFILKMDRWTLALAGIQNLDQSFNYHVSLVKTPLLFKIGANLSGPDFDNIKLRLGKAKYKSVNVPVFSQVIDTTRINLRTSIVNIFNKSVETAVRENKEKNALRNARIREKYNQSVALDSLEALSGKEQADMDSYNRQQAFEEDMEANKAVLDTMSNPAAKQAFVDSLKVKNGLVVETAPDDAALGQESSGTTEKSSAARRRRRD